MSKSIALPQDTTNGLLNLVQSWEPPTIPHCSNCRYARVEPGSTATSPLVACAQGHGRGAISLFRLIRSYSPRGFRSAITCPDFESMSDEP